MLKLSHFHVELYIVLIFIFLLASCSDPNVSTPQESEAFAEWELSVPREPEAFVEWWNACGRQGWKFSYYGENGITYPDRSTPEEVWKSKIINCNRFVILFRPILGGKVRVYPQDGSPYSHVTLLLDSGEELSLTGLIVSILKESDRN